MRSSVSPSTSLGMCLSSNDASDECDVHHQASHSLDADPYEEEVEKSPTMLPLFFSIPYYTNLINLTIFVKRCR